MIIEVRSKPTSHTSKCSLCSGEILRGELEIRCFSKKGLYSDGGDICLNCIVSIAKEYRVKKNDVVRENNSNTK